MGFYKLISRGVLDMDNLLSLLCLVKILRKEYLLYLIIIISFVFISPIATATAASSPTLASINDISQEDKFYLTQINQLRIRNNRHVIYYDYQLKLSADTKIRSMINNNYFAHKSPDNTEFAYFIWKQKPDALYVGENLARCYIDREAAYNALINSPTHLNVMLDKKFKYFGISEETNINNHCVYTVMHFSD